MKRITLINFAALLWCCLSFAQVGIVQNFANTNIPPGWSTDVGDITTFGSCNGGSWFVNIYAFETEGTLTSPQQVSNGSDLTISFDYKIVNFDDVDVATSPYDGTIITQVSVDGGATWSVDAGTINNVNHIPSTTCATVSYVVPAASVPSGAQVQVRWLCTFGTSGDYYIYIDNVSATQVSTTPPPCTVLSVPANGATDVVSPVVSWESGGGVPTGYRISVGTTPGGTDVVNNADAGNVNNYNIGILLPGTTYYVTIVPYNALGNATGCTETSFSTCNTSTTPFIEEFTTSASPVCWSRGTGGTLASGPSSFAATNGWVSDGFANNGFSGAVKVNIYQNIRNDWFISPAISIPDNGYQLKFSAAANEFASTSAPVSPWEADDIVQVLIQVAGTASWQEVLVFNSTNVPPPTGSVYIIPLAAFAGQDVRVAFRVLEGSNVGDADIDFSIDNFEINEVPTSPPSCATLTTPAEGAQNVTSPIISWAVPPGTPTGYKITVGTTPTGTEIVNNVNVGNLTTYNLGSLLPGTTYYVTIIPYNGSGDATGCLPSTFSTCPALTVPVLEQFNTAAPQCWTRGTGGAPATGPANLVATNNWVADGFGNVGTSGAIAITINGATKNAWVISPAISIPDNGYQLKFRAAATQNSSTSAPSTPWEADDFIQVLVQVVGTNTWQEVFLFNNTNTPPNTGIEAIVALASFAGQDIRVAFRGVEGAQDGLASIQFFIDDFEVEPVPNTPPDCTSLSTPADGADNVISPVLSWSTPSGSAIGYRLTVGTTPNGSEILNNFDVGNVTTYNLGTLTISTTYYVTVIPYNAAGNATGCPTTSFSSCGVSPAPVLETFDTANPECWTRARGGSAATGPDTPLIQNFWVAGEFGFSGFSDAIVINIFNAFKNDWLISPAINIPATGYELKFDAAATDFADPDQLFIPWEEDDFVQVLVQVVGTTTWQEVILFNNTNVPPTNGAAYTVNLSAYAGQNIRIAFRGVEGTQNGAADIYFSLDNFEIREIPTAVPGCATNIGANINSSCGNFDTTILWNSVANADGYLLSIGTTNGGTDIVNAANIGTTTSYNFAGNIATTYFVTLIPYNSAGNATGCTSVEFTTAATGCYCESFPSSVDGQGVTQVVIETQTFANGDTYVNNTASPITFAAGDEVNIALTFNTYDGFESYDYNTNIWVDYNNNFSFESSELVFTGVAPDISPTIFNASFTIPSGTAAGQYRMRIGAADTGQQVPNPCYNDTFGLTIDFLLNVDVANAVEEFSLNGLKAYPNPAKDVLTLTSTAEISKVEVYNMLGQLVLSKETNAAEVQLEMSGLNAGTYIVKVASGNSSNSLKIIKE